MTVDWAYDHCFSYEFPGKQESGFIMIGKIGPAQHRPNVGLFVEGQPFGTQSRSLPKEKSGDDLIENLDTTAEPTSVIIAYLASSVLSWALL